MYKKLGEANLKSGELMEVGVVITPDIDYSNELGEFLGHKPDHYKWHIDQCLQKTLDQLETRFYIGKLNGQIISNIMTTEFEGIGILGHVFTLPDQRRKGACKGIMTYQMQDFASRSGRMLYLGTGYDSAPYWIYHYFGFRSVYPKSVFMKYSAHIDSETKHFFFSESNVKKVEWNDWSHLTALTGIVDGTYFRSTISDIKGPTNFESGFLRLKQNLQIKPDHYKSLLLKTGNGAIVAFANLDVSNNKKAYLDLFSHPSFWSQTPRLITEMEFPPDARVICETGYEDYERIAVLEQINFKQKSHYETEDGRQILIFEN